MNEHTGVIIIGSGFAGLAMAFKLREAGFDDVLILEKATDIGGTWRDNTYPGCACDVPSHLYSYSFAPNSDWSRSYAPQAEIRAYIEGCATRFGIRPMLRLGAEVVRAELDQGTARWTVHCKDGRVFTSRFVVAAAGGLSRPAEPELAGRERYQGALWHSARWNHRIPLAGKRVAVVGTGASAIQIVPRLARMADHLQVYQRTPPWILPHPDREYRGWERRLLRHALPRWLYRQLLFWRHEARAIPFVIEPRLLELAQKLALRHLHRQVRDRDLLRLLRPDYTMGCKRVLLSNDYYPALARGNVELVASGIARLTETGIEDQDGVHRRCDAIIMATGFAVHDYLGPVEVIGKDGVELGDLWRRTSAAAYLGTTVPGFPNLFVLIGPNTGLGHNSIIYMIECQVRYVISALRAMRRGGYDSVEPVAEVVDEYNRRIQARLGRTVWASGCKSWYQDPHGRNTTLWPGPSAEFMLRTMRFDPRSYVMKRLPAVVHSSHPSLATPQVAS